MPRAPTATPLTTTMFAKVVALLYKGDKSIQEMADELECSYIFVMHVCRALYDQKVVHITGWLPDDLGRNNIIIYKMGRGRDAIKKVKTTAEKSATYRALKKSKSKHLQGIFTNVTRQANH